MSAEKATTDGAVTTPVSSARRGSLEHLLKSRPGREELVEKNILPASTAAPAIQAQQKELQKSMLADKLDGALKHRPDRAELVEKNILPASHAAPALLAHQKELEMHMRADKLDDALRHRKSPEDVVKSGILHNDPRSLEDRYAEAIEDEYAKREGGA